MNRNKGLEGFLLQIWGTIGVLVLTAAFFPTHSTGATPSKVSASTTTTPKISAKPKDPCLETTAKAKVSLEEKNGFRDVHFGLTTSDVQADLENGIPEFLDFVEDKNGSLDLYDWKGELYNASPIQYVTFNGESVQVPAYAFSMLRYFHRSSEKLELFDIPILRVEYFFHSGNLYAIQIFSRAKNASLILERLAEAMGQPQCKGTGILMINTQKLSIFGTFTPVPLALERSEGYDGNGIVFVFQIDHIERLKEAHNYMKQTAQEYLFHLKEEERLKKEEEADKRAKDIKDF